MTLQHPSGDAAGASRDTAVEAIRHLLDVRRFPEARTRASALVAERPADREALCLLAQALLGEGYPSGAMNAAQQAIAADPEHEWGYRLASIAHQKLGQRRHARDAAYRATSLAPHAWQGWVQLADASRGLPGLEAEALHAAGEARRLAPHEPAVHVNYGVAVMRSDPAGARTAFEEALRLDPMNYAAQNNLAVVDLRRRRLRRAGEGLIRAAAADPRDTLAQHNLRVAAHRILWRVYLVVGLATFALALANGDEGRSPVPTPLAAGWLGVEVLALSLLAWWLRRLTPPLRRHLWRLVTRDPVLRIFAAALAAMAVLGTLGIVVPGPAGFNLRVLAFLVLIAARLLSLISAFQLRGDRKAGR